MLEPGENNERILAIWNDVKSFAPTDDEALDIFCDSWLRDGLLACKSCGSCNFQLTSGCRSFDCDDCGATNWITSGTLLTRVERFQAYLTASIIRESGLFISASALGRLTGVHQSTAFNIERKLNMAIANQMPVNAHEISGRFFEIVIAKRSRLTSANMHPYTEQKLIDEELSKQAFTNSLGEDDDSDELAPVDDYALAKKKALSMLSDVGTTADTIASATGISIGRVVGCLFELELDGKARSEPGGKYYLCAPSPVQQYQYDSKLAASVTVKAVDFVTMVKRYFHRVSRKGMQNYMARLWCGQDKARWGAGSIVALCGTHKPIRYRDMLDYVSPPMLRIMLC